MSNMNPQNLRVGNFIKTIGVPDPICINEQLLHSLLTVENYHKLYGGFPITADRLKKFGLEPINAGALWQIPIGSNLDIIYYLAIDLKGWMGLKLDGPHYIGLRYDIEFEHQLQNIYHSLTGKELKIYKKISDLPRISKA